MIAAFIFLLLLLSLGSMYLKRPVLTILLFMISLGLIMVLFIHHATDALGVSL